MSESSSFCLTRWRTCLCTKLMLLAAALVVSSAQEGQQAESSCPARVRPQPGLTMGVTAPWNYYGNPDRFSLFSSQASNSSSHCCAGGSVSNWTVGLTAEYQWIGSLSATCSDGQELPAISFGFNGTDAEACNSSVMDPPITTTIENGTYTFRQSYVVTQLFGVGRPYLSADTLIAFRCNAGFVPIGFSAKRACYSLVDIHVLCAPPYESDNATDAGDAVLLKDRQTCPSSVEAVPQEQLGRTDAWATIGDDPIYSSAAGPAESDCCTGGSFISNWTILYSDYQSGMLGQIFASCSDGNTLAPVRYGYNESTSGDCDNPLDFGIRTPNPDEFNYRVVNNDTVDTFIGPLPLIFFGGAGGLTTPAGVAGGISSFKCPDEYVPVGYSAQPACLALANLKVLCAPAASLGAPAPAPQSAITAPSPAPVEIIERPNPYLTELSPSQELD